MQRIELVLCKEEVLRAKAKENQSAAGRDNYRACEQARAKAGKLRTKTTKPQEESIDVRETLVKEADVGQGTVQRYLQIKNSGKPELLEKYNSAN